MKRHKVQHPSEGRHYNWRDFDVGYEIEVYGRVFKLIDADDFTRKFYNHEGI